MSLREEVDMATWTRICCPIDFSETSRVAMEEAAELARLSQGEMALLHVFEPPAATADLMVTPPEMLDQTARELERKLELWKSEAERRGAKVARSLVVSGTHGRRGIRHLVLGSVAERVVREAPCAVLVVRPRSR